MRSKRRKLKAQVIVVGLALSLLSLASCTTKVPTKPEPMHIEYGMAGEQPKEVTNSYDWTCFDNNLYRERLK
jgi:hypothetical protein